ncbi:MAG: hypothetical protein AAF717_15185 [Bacteroidota bacterium]
MKKVFFFFILIFISCSDDDTELTDNALDGKWVLREVSCFCFFAEDFEFSQHSLAFESEQQQVTIENSIDTFFITGQAGVYPFTATGDIVKINDDREYSYEVSDETLTLRYIDDPDIADDEITLMYNKD